MPADILDKPVHRGIAQVGKGFSGMPLPPGEVEFAGRFPQENLTSGNVELHFRFGADSELLADVLGDGYVPRSPTFIFFSMIRKSYSVKERQVDCDD